MIRILVSVTTPDAAPMATLLAGLGAHSEADAFPIWTEGDPALPEMLFKLLPHLRNLHDTWIVTLWDADTLRTFIRLMESVVWQGEIIMANDEATKKWTAAEFHKAVTVTREVQA